MERGGVDFLKRTRPMRGTNIVTNPPYKFANEFIEKSLELIDTGKKIAMFLPIRYVEGKKRRKLLDEHPPKRIWVSSSRINCAMNGDFETYKQNSMVCYCWFIWEKGWKGDTTIKWFN